MSEEKDSIDGGTDLVDMFFGRMLAKWEDANYCALGIEKPEERDCVYCTMNNYGLDCHNEKVRERRETDDNK